MSDKKFIPPGFDEGKVLAGLYTAMGFGEPTSASGAEATFYFRTLRVDGNEEVDSDSVPFDPDEHKVNVAAPTHRTIPCAVEFIGREGSPETFGLASPSRIKITILQPEWDIVSNFAYVVAAGDKYIREKLEPVVALGSIDVYTVWCVAESER